MEYTLSSLGLEEHELCLGLELLGGCTYTYKNKDHDTIIFLGRIDDPLAPLPNPKDIKDAYNEYTSSTISQNDMPKIVPNKLLSYDGSYTFVTSIESSTSVTIPEGSNSIATHIDPSRVENVKIVDGREYVEKVSSLPICTYNIINQSHSSVRIGPMPQDWNTVFNFEAKDPTLQNIELMDTIGVLLACVKNLSERIEILESKL